MCILKYFRARKWVRGVPISLRLPWQGFKTTRQIPCLEGRLKSILAAMAFEGPTTTNTADNDFCVLRGVLR